MAKQVHKIIKMKMFAGKLMQFSNNNRIISRKISGTNKRVNSIQKNYLI